MPDLSSLPISVPMIFLIAQVVIVGSFVLMHFFLGLKRGVKKSLFYLIGHIALVFLLFWLIGLFSLSWIFNEANIRAWFGEMAPIDLTINEYLDILVEANALPLLFAILDLIAKIILFIVFYVVLRSLLTLILYAWAWRFFKPSEDDDRPKQRLLGGLIGIVRGAFAGFIIIFPLLVLINVVVGEGVEIENSEYEELVTELSAANEYNFVRYVNTVKLGEVGLADFMVDLAFRSQVSGTNQVVIWRAEFEWMAEFLKAAAPILVPTNSQQTGIVDGEFTLDYEEFQTFRSAFEALEKSTLIDSSLAPAFIFGINTIAKEYTEIPEETLSYIKEAILESDISLTGDLNIIFEAVSELLSIQNLDGWMTTFEDPKSILGFSDADQDHLKNAIAGLTSLSLFKVSDYALEFMLYTDEVKDQITWVEEADKAAYINNIRDKIRNYESDDSDSLIGASLIELGDLISTIAFDFPGVTVDDVTYDLVEFIDNIGNLMIVLNDDPDYHTWFHSTLNQIAGLSLFDTFLEELIGFGTNQISLGDGWTEEEMEAVKAIIRNNFSDHEDLETQFLWVADVYQAIGEFGVGPMFAEDADMITVFDDIMRGVDGPTKFNNLIDVLLEGQIISDITNQMSDALIAKYVEDPMLREPFDKVLAIDGFSFIDEVRIIANVIGQLYQIPTFSLADALAEGADPLDILLPSLLEFVDSEANRALVLSSDVIYALIDIQLSGINEITIPDQVKESSGDYQGWIKRSELSTVLEIFVAMDIDTIPADQDGIDTLITDVLAFTATEANRTLVLSSDLIYFIISDQLLNLEIENFTIPETAIETSGTYNTWIMRSEIEKLLHALSILEITELPGEEGFPLDDITSVQLGQVIDLDSKILTRMITTQLKNAQLISLPIPAFTDGTQADLTFEELQAIAQLLEDLDLSLSVLNDGSNSEDLLESITVANLTSVEYESSWVIRAFVTYGITTALETTALHPLSVDSEYDTILSSEEIGALFDALDALDGGLGQSLNDLVESLNPSTMTVSHLSLVVNVGSVLINEQVTLAVEAEFTLHEKALDSRTLDPEIPNLIDQAELVRLTDAIEVVDDGANQSITTLITALNPNTLTFGQTNSIVDIDSIIIRSVISENILDVELISELNIKDLAYEDQLPSSNLLTKDEVEHLVDALNHLAASPDDAVMPVVNTLNPQTISLGLVEDMVAEESLILRTLISDELKSTDGFEIHPDALDSDSDVTQTDLNQLFSALSISLGENVLISDLAGLASTITIGQIRTFNDQTSLIKDGMISKMVIDNIPGGASSIRYDAYDAVDRVKAEPFGMLDANEITNVFDAIYLLSNSDNDALLTDLMSSLSNTALITIGQVTDAVSEQSIIINSIISESLIPILVLADIHPDALEDNVNLDQVTFVTEIKRLDMIDLFSALETLDSNATLDDLQTLLGDTLTITDIQTMRAENSIILEGKVSKIVESSVTPARIVDDAYVPADPFGLIKPTEITNLLLALDEFAGGSAIGNASTQLANEAPNLSVAELESIHSHNSYIIRYFISEGILAFADPNINEDAYEVGYVDEYYTAAEITRIINSIKVLTDNDPNAELQTAISGMTPGSVESAKLAQLFPAGNYSYVIQRKTSVIINNLDLSGLGVTVPESAYIGGDSNNIDIKDEEFRAMSNALVALGFNTLELDNITAETTPIADVKNALEEESLLVNRIISKAIVDAGFDTVESHVGTEDPNVDIQLDEMINMTEAFIAFGINDIDGATSTNPATLIGNAQLIDRDDFKAYIDYDELDESLGLTLVKEFLYDLIAPIYENEILYPTHDDLDTRVELDYFIYEEF